MSEQQTLPPRVGREFADQPHAYDPVVQNQLFDVVIFKRTIAFLIDAIIISVLTVVAYVVVELLGFLMLCLVRVLFRLVFSVFGLGYNAVTIGGTNAATIGQGLMGLEVRMWF